MEKELEERVLFSKILIVHYVKMKSYLEYFASVVPAADNKFAALNSAVWSGGSFIYVPKNVKLDTPLQAYFRINSENMDNSNVH